MKTLINTVRYSIEETQEAATMLWKGGLVAIPTETVYGLTANARDGVAVQKIFDLKDRDYAKPISVLVSGMEMVERYCQNIPPVAYRLAEKYWPGPLTMVLEDKGVVPLMVTAETDTLGVRCPDHPLALDIIKKADFPLAATSANLSGKEPAKNAQEVLAYFDGKIEGVVDGGSSALGVASTVVDLTEEEPKVLREGGIPTEELLAFIREHQA